jgi:hypothetical protein
METPVAVLLDLFVVPQVDSVRMFSTDRPKRQKLQTIEE